MTTGKESGWFIHLFTVRCYQVYRYSILQEKSWDKLWGVTGDMHGGQVFKSSLIIVPTLERGNDNAAGGSWQHD